MVEGINPDSIKPLQTGQTGKLAQTGGASEATQTGSAQARNFFASLLRQDPNKIAEDNPALAIVVGFLQKKMQKGEISEQNAIRNLQAVLLKTTSPGGEGGTPLASA